MSEVPHKVSRRVQASELLRRSRDGAQDDEARRKKELYGSAKGADTQADTIRSALELVGEKGKVYKAAGRAYIVLDRNAVGQDERSLVSTANTYIQIYDGGDHKRKLENKNNPCPGIKSGNETDVANYLTLAAEFGVGQGIRDDVRAKEAAVLAPASAEAAPDTVVEGDANPAKPKPTRKK